MPSPSVLASPEPAQPSTPLHDCSVYTPSCTLPLSGKIVASGVAGRDNKVDVADEGRATGPAPQA